MFGNALVDVIVQTGAIVAALAVILRPVRGAATRWLVMRDTWEDMREDMAAIKASAAEADKRLADVEDAMAELRPNSGTTMHDRIGTLRERQEQIAAKQQADSELIAYMATFFDGAVPEALLPDTKGTDDV